MCGDQIRCPAGREGEVREEKQTFAWGIALRWVCWWNILERSALKEGARLPPGAPLPNTLILLVGHFFLNS